MKALMLEVRDKGTFIPILAVDMSPNLANEGDRYLLRRAGFGSRRCIQVTHLNHGLSHYDPYHWPGGTRTMKVAHHFIDENFDSLKSGDVIDVEFILGETKNKKISERFGVY